MKVIILSGAVGQGKTKLVRNIIDDLHEGNVSTGGIFSLKIMEDHTVTGYDVVDITTKVRTPFLRMKSLCSSEKTGRYFICQEGLQAGRETLMNKNIKYFGVVIIDEVGRLELENKGWSDQITHIVESFNNILILAVRDINTDAVIRKWNFEDFTILNVSENTSGSVCNLIKRLI